MKTYDVAVVGAAGFAGAELVRLLLGHPQFILQAITSDSLSGQRLDSVYPAFAGLSDLVFQSHDDADVAACDLVFLAVPHKASLKVTPALIAADTTVIDLSADYRLKDPAVYEKWYATPHTSTDLLTSAAFGLPELTGDELARAAERFGAGEAVLVACAGCYPTATGLAATPALRGGIVEDRLIVVDAISGVTGAGKTANERTHFCFANENVEAYGVGAHRHTPEIEQILNVTGGLVFTPHLAPLNRGLLSTVTMALRDDVQIDGDELQQLYEEFYQDASMVKVMAKGRYPKTSSVAGTNFAHVGVALSSDKRSVIALGAIDNLGKGAAGQAVQCANIVCGFDESLGLCAPALPI